MSRTLGPDLPGSRFALLHKRGILVSTAYLGQRFCKVGDAIGDKVSVLIDPTLLEVEAYDQILE